VIPISVIFEVADKSGRKIRLTSERWSHIRKKHPEVEDYEMIEETVKKPIKVVECDPDETVRYYYKYYKRHSAYERYLQVVVK